MIGILLVLLAGAFREIGTVIGKHKAMRFEESPYSLGFLSLFWASIFYLLFAIFIRGEFVFALASLPTLALRIPLEIAQAHVTMRAIISADRSTFGFLRIWTIPLILIVDLLLGYDITTVQILGITSIVLAFIFLFINHGIQKKGAGLVLFTAVNAVITISLFKYNITYFNSVETEQLITVLILLLYFFLMARRMTHERPLLLLKTPVYFVQSFCMGAGAILVSFAFLYAPASVITTAKRSASILFSMLSGHLYFKEKKFLIKLVAFLLILAGIVLLTLPLVWLPFAPLSPAQ